MAGKYLCIHGHFYQPPRESPWLEEIEQQDSAAPFHDWNERITAECYGPNAFSRILNEEGFIVNILNNYSRISFNFGPTLLNWMQKHATDVYDSILRADELSKQFNNGHGSALAQVYNHIIMPLANQRDKETQIVWGIKDFESRFKRKPEGMWLAETAVDTATLEVLAEHDIQFTILAPRQAKAVKMLNSGSWQDVSGEKINTNKAYVCKLPSGKSIHLFFYNGAISQKIAFTGLLDNGSLFAESLIEGFHPDDAAPQLVNVATDGESYGHHHKHGDMALAFCINYLANRDDVELVNYARFLEVTPPDYEVQIFENSSWSCVHGIERWRKDCGCNTGASNGWNQKWRAPLREALNWLSDKTATVFETEMKAYCHEPWIVRNEYIQVINERSEKNLDRFILHHGHTKLNKHQRTRFVRLLEMQRHAMLMFTSCAWFFDEVSGIETVQILQYADRVIQLVESETDVRLMDEFSRMLENVPSNVAEFQNASGIYQKYVSPARLTLSKVGMHYAVASLFEDYPESLVICNYHAESEVYERLEAGILKLAVGKTKINSIITHSEKIFYFAVIYLGQNHFLGNSAAEMDEAEFNEMKDEITDAFSKSRVADVIGIMQTYFGPEKFSLWSLLKDEQRKILYQILQKDINQAEDSYKKIYNRNYNIMTVLKNAELPVPQLLTANVQTVINNEIKNFFKGNILYPARLEKLAKEVTKWDVKLYKDEIAFAASQRLLGLINELHSRYADLRFIQMINRVFNTLHAMQIDLPLLRIQNEFFKIASSLFGSNAETCVVVNEENQPWIDAFYQLGHNLKVKIN
jgi:alpha-amylase/alpha-mannosidase (GH57 family)